MKTNFDLLNENTDRTKTRSYMFNFFLPCTGSQAMKTFFIQVLMIGMLFPTVLRKLKVRTCLRKNLKMHLMKEWKMMKRNNLPKNKL